MIRSGIRMPRWSMLLVSLVFISIISSNLQADKPLLTVYFLDVGQGDSTVISSPAGRVALIDSGMGGPLYKRKDKGKTVIIPFLKGKGITKLDTVIMTHADSDHIGGLVYLIENTKAGGEYPIEIKEFLDPGQPHTTNLYQVLLQAVKLRPEIKYRIAKRGDLLDLGEGVRAEVVAPDHIYSDPNNSSIVIKLTYGKVSFLFTGDAEGESEKAMVMHYGDGLKSAVLKVGHHGSAQASGSEFLKRVKPEVAVISVGEKNKFSLPFKEVLQRLEAAGAKIYRTDYQGMITISTDGESYTVTTEKETPPIENRWDTPKVLKEEDKINVNTASEAELVALPLIGKGKARAIIARRPFSSIEDLRAVPGIGPKTMDKIRPLITVSIPGKAAPLIAGATPINSITSNDAGRKVPTLAGEIVAVKVFRGEKGRTLTIRDGTGAIDVLIWKNLFNVMPQRDKLTKGTRVSVKGKVGSYQGKLQIQPAVPGDIRILEQEESEKPSEESAAATGTVSPALKRAA